MPQNAFFFYELATFWSAKKWRTLFFHPPSPFHGNFCNCNSIGICTASRFWVQLPLLYTAWSKAYSEIGPEVCCNLLRERLQSAFTLANQLHWITQYKWMLTWKISVKIPFQATGRSYTNINNRNFSTFFDLVSEWWQSTLFHFQALKKRSFITKFHWERKKKESQSLQSKSFIIYYICIIFRMLQPCCEIRMEPQVTVNDQIISQCMHMEYDARVDLFFHAPENGVSLGCLSALRPCPWWRPGQTLCQWHHATLPLLPRFLGQVGLPPSDHHTSADKKCQLVYILSSEIPIKVFPSRDIEPLSPLFWGIECVTSSLFSEVLRGTSHVKTKTVL